MPNSDRHGLRRADRLGVGGSFRRRRASTSSASTTTCAPTSSAPTHRPRLRRSDCSTAIRTPFARSSSTSATAEAIDRLFAEQATAARAGHPHRRAAVARLGGVRAADRLHRQCERHAQPARGDAPPHAGGDVRLHLDQQGLRRPAQRAAAGRAGDAARAARGSSLPPAASTPRCRSTAARTRSSAPRRPLPTCSFRSTGAISSMPTVCFRGGCLTGPNHAGARLHGFLSYLMRCAITGDPYTVFGYDGKQVRDNIHSADLVAAFAAFHASPRSGARLQHRRRARQQLLDARGDRALRADQPAASSTGRSATTPRIGDHRWWISDLSEFRRDYPGWEIDARRRGRSCSEIYEQNVELAGLAAADEALGRHPGSQRGRLDRAAMVAATTRALERGGDRLRAARRRRLELGRHEEGRERRRRREPARALPPSRNARADSVSRCAAGLEAFSGDAVAIMMADGSDHPEDLVDVLPRCSRRDTTALSARGSFAELASTTIRAEAGAQPARQLVDPRRSSATATTTRPTPSRPIAAR